MPFRAQSDHALILPNGPIEVNPSHPLAQGLVSAYVPGKSSPTFLQDYGPAKINLTPAASWSKTNGILGAGQKGTATGQYASLTAPTAHQLQPPFTILWIGDTSGTADASITIFGVDRTSGAAPYVGYGVLASASGTVFQLSWNSSGTFASDGGAAYTIPTGGLISLGGVFTAAGTQTYGNGIVRATSGAAGTISYANGYTTTLGTSAGANTRIPRKTAFAAYLWNRALTPSEMAELHNNPFALFQPRVPKVYRLGSRAPTGAYTLTAATGALTLTGTATGLKASRALTAVTGAYTLTGTDTGLKAGRTITAATGAFTETGNAAGLVAARQLAAGTGAYTLTGQDAGLNYAATNPTLTAETGAFTLAGGNVTFTVTRAAGTGGRVRKVRQRRARDFDEGNRDFLGNGRNSRPGVAEEEMREVMASVRAKSVPIPMDSIEDDDEEAILWII